MLIKFIEFIESIKLRVSPTFVPSARDYGGQCRRSAPAVRHPPSQLTLTCPLKMGIAHRFFQCLLPVADVRINGGLIHGGAENPVG